MDILERMAEALWSTRADVANSMGLSPDVSEADATVFLRNMLAERDRRLAESCRVVRERQKIMGQLRQIEHDQAAVQLVAGAAALLFAPAALGDDDNGRGDGRDRRL